MGFPKCQQVRRLKFFKTAGGGRFLIIAVVWISCGVENCFQVIEIFYLKQKMLGFTLFIFSDWWKKLYKFPPQLA